MAYNFTANTNGPVFYQGEDKFVMTPARGCADNNLPLMWLEVDVAKEIPDIKAILNVGINDLLLFLDFNNFNHIGHDAVNRCDQHHRSPANFSVWELRNSFNF